MSCKIFEPNYKVTRNRDSDGELNYFIHRPNQKTVMIIKSGPRLYKPVSRKQPYYRTLRDAIMGVVNQ